METGHGQQPEIEHGPRFMFVDRVRVPRVDHFVEPLILDGPAAVALWGRLRRFPPELSAGSSPIPNPLVVLRRGEAVADEGFSSPGGGPPARACDT